MRRTQEEEFLRTLSSKSPSLKALNIKELLSLEIPPREMILGPLIPAQGLVMIHAPRGIGKTHISLLIAYTVAMGGQMFDGRWVSGKPHKVLFVDGEMPLSALQERLAKMACRRQAEEIHEENLLIITPDLQDQCLPDLLTLEGQRYVEEHLEDEKLHILDNYSALCRRGRENEAESWLPLQEWFLGLRRRGISVLLIHHSNKMGSQRGTSRKEDLLDTILTLRKPENYAPQEGARLRYTMRRPGVSMGKKQSPLKSGSRRRKRENLSGIHVTLLIRRLIKL